MNNNKGSMLEVAYRILEEEGKGLPFTELWARVKEFLEITPEEERDRVGHFYADLSLAGGLTILKNNEWDLSERHFYDPKANQSDIYDAPEEEDDKDEEEKKEEEEYDKSVDGAIIKDDEEETLHEDEEEAL